MAKHDALIPRGLPASPRQHRGWWTNAVSADEQRADCLGAGWKVDAVTLGDRVTFARTVGAEAQDLTPTTVRLGGLVPEMLLVLRGAGEPVPRSEVLSRVADRVDFTPHELEPAGKAANQRWSNHLSWSSTSLAAIGWLDQTESGRVITEAGRAVARRGKPSPGCSRVGADVKLVCHALDWERTPDQVLRTVDQTARGAVADSGLMEVDHRG